MVTIKIMHKLITILLIAITTVTYGQKGIGLKFEYNNTRQPKIVPLAGMYMTMKGTYVSTSVTIAPYSSVILIKLDSPPLALQVKSFSLSTGTNTTTMQAVIVDDKTGQQKVITYKYRFK